MVTRKAQAARTEAMIPSARFEQRAKRRAMKENPAAMGLSTRASVRE